MNNPEEVASPINLGFTDDPFDPQTLTAATYDGSNPWTLGHNAGVRPTGPVPFPNLLVTVNSVFEAEA